MPLVDTNNIIVRNRNIRSKVDQEKLNELMDSIKERGILQPLVCREINGKYELIAGNRRLEAAKRLGFKKVPIIIRETKDTDIQFDQIIENLQREDMSAEDKFSAFKQMKNEGLSIAQISQKTGVNQTTISSILALENLKDGIRSRNDIDEYPKQLIAKAPISIQDILANRVSKGELSIRCLLADILPTLNKIEKDEILSADEKKNTINRIAKETIFKEYPAKTILAQEIGKKKMELAGVKPKVVSINTLEQYLNKARSFSNTLYEIEATHLQYLDKSTVLKLFVALRDIRDHLNSMLAITEKGKKHEKS